MPLELHGRDETNVPIFTGAPEAHSSGPWLFSIGAGAVLVGIYLVAGFHALVVQRDVARFIAALLVGGLISGGLVAGSIWWYRITRELPNLASLEDLAARLGLDAGALRIHATKNGIRPRVSVNGRSLYRPRDFGDSGSLLRAASGPSSTPGSMLRSSLPMNTDCLPRPAFSPDSLSDNPQELEHGPQ